jgi:hypothetical protein
MIWTSRLRRMGSLANITAARERQVKLLNLAGANALGSAERRRALRAEIDRKLRYLAEHYLRYLTADEEAFWAAIAR